MIFISGNVKVNKTEFLVILAGDVRGICEYAVTLPLHPDSVVLKS